MLIDIQNIMKLSNLDSNFKLNNIIYYVTRVYKKRRREQIANARASPTRPDPTRPPPLAHLYPTMTDDLS